METDPSALLVKGSVWTGPYSPAFCLVRSDQEDVTIIPD